MRRQLGDVGDIASAMDTARPASDQDPETAARRARQRVAARGNLAAVVCDLYEVDLANASPRDLVVRVAAAEFAELVEVLGLDGPAPAPPGTCHGCGKVRPGVSLRAGGAYKAGLCMACSRDADPPPAREPAWVTFNPLAAAVVPYQGGTGRCTDCGGREYRLTPSGRFLPHPAWRTTAAGAAIRCDYDCPGSGRLADSAAPR